MKGRAIFCEEGLIPIRIDASAGEPAFLSGKYSQTFVDEMARQLTREIAASQGISGLSGSSIELRLVFSPETYMEHTAESVTYRRLLITDKGCAPRDFWVKWTRLDSAAAYTVSDSPAPDTISFEIGEDVPQKIREREYRFLMRVDGDKFHSAMSRKSVTEWREILRRAIRRGDLIKAELDESLSEERDADLREQLSAILGVKPAPAPKAEPERAAEGEDELVRMAREAIMGASRSEEEIAATLAAAPAAEEPFDDLSVSLADDAEEAEALKDLAALDGEPEAEPEIEVVAEPEVEVVAEPAEEEKPAATEDDVRREIEAKLRLEYEARARAAAEEEAARLRLENERLMAKARLDEEARLAEQARIKAEIEEELRREAREKERIAEQAMLAMEERRRKEAERAEAERLRRLEEEKAAEAKRVAEENARRAAERAREEERIRLERQRAEELARALEEQNKPKYISRTAEFSFRRTVDPNITKHIYEIVKGTIEFYHKEDVYIRIKASVPDSTTVRLEFLEVPEEEGELIVNIIKVLGKSDLGIAKATLD